LWPQIDSTDPVKGYIDVHFLCLPKENEPAAKRRKKRHPVTCPAVGGIPFAPRSCREFKNPVPPSGTQTVQTPFSATSVVLGCVTMGRNKEFVLVPHFRDFLMPAAK